MPLYCKRIAWLFPGMKLTKDKNADVGSTLANVRFAFLCLSSLHLSLLHLSSLHLSLVHLSLLHFSLLHLSSFHLFSAENYFLGEENSLHVCWPIWPWSIWERDLGEDNSYIRFYAFVIDLQGRMYLQLFRRAYFFNKHLFRSDSSSRWRKIIALLPTTTGLMVTVFLRFCHLYLSCSD